MTAYNDLKFRLGRFGSAGAGIGLQISNDYVAAEFQVVFRTDRQFPATPYGVYMLEAILNGKAMMGSPFAVRVDPGPVYGPNCEIVGLTAETGDSLLEATVATEFELEVIARDRFGNRHAFSDRPENWVVEMIVVKGVTAGQSSVVKVRFPPFILMIFRFDSSSRNFVYIVLPVIPVYPQFRSWI
jgi:hypothetical protein